MRTLSLKLCSKLCLSAVALFGATARADVKLPALFSDNMVLQRQVPVPFWGTADAGEEVTVTLRGQSATTTAGADGKWIVRLPALEAGDPAAPFEVTVAGKNTLTFKNVLVGDVWLASGQSNMEFVVAGGRSAQAEIAAANDPALRMFTVRKAVADEPITDLAGAWQEANPQNVGRFSAVAYFFARDLRQKLNVPIGVIHTSWGGTPAQAWTSRVALAADPDLQKLLDERERTIANLPKAKEDADKKIAEWQQAADAAKAAGQPEPPNKPKPFDARKQNWPTDLYNAMIAPLVPYGIKGAIWYQGESNAGAATQYQKLFPAMIANWRKDWGQGDFPFGFVQLANFQKRQEQPVEGGWADVREAQTMTLAAPNTGMAVITDIGEADDIHPKNKQDVGHRLALWALSQVYSQTVPAYSGPLYDSMIVEGDKIRLHFKHTEGGLKAGSKETGESSVPKSHWAYAALNKLAQAGAIEPPAAPFGSATMMTRRDFSTTIAKMLEAKPVLKVNPDQPPPAGAIATQQQLDDVLNALQREFAFDLAAADVKVNPLQGFAIAGADKKWVWADAKIEGDTVVVSSPQVPAPVAVRYSWASNPLGNLYNGADLPASPFRTDK